jgi:UDP-N-acetylglucosamine transferase subunit ALG13
LLNHSSPRILVAPLNWGLGHATRCIPLIKALLQLRCEVILATNGAAAALLQKEFPTLPLLTIPGTEIRYTRYRNFFVWRMLLQLPAIIQQVQQENQWLKKEIKKLKLDAVIADNRYGLYHPGIPCILITHQLWIKSGWGNGVDTIGNFFALKAIRRFNEVWVPDYQGIWALAGALSNPAQPPRMPVKYIGLLNRFNNTQPSLSLDSPSHILIVLSGPEPQRTAFEMQCKKGLQTYSGSFTMVCGKPTATSLDTAETTHQLALLYGKKTAAFYDHLEGDCLQQEIEKASYIICRSGYTSLMELLPLQKKLILIPTPGQPEQEYLGDYCMQKGYALCLSQKEFSLSSALQQAHQFSYRAYTPPATLLESHLQNWLTTQFSL